MQILTTEDGMKGQDRADIQRQLCYIKQNRHRIHQQSNTLTSYDKKKEMKMKSPSTRKTQLGPKPPKHWFKHSNSFVFLCCVTITLYHQRFE
jgi:hypothetical protein